MVITVSYRTSNSNDAIIVTFQQAAIESIDFDLRDLSRTLGSTEIQASIRILREALGAWHLAILAGFNRDLQS